VDLRLAGSHELIVLEAGLVDTQRAQLAQPELAQDGMTTPQPLEVIPDIARPEAHDRTIVPRPRRHIKAGKLDGLWLRAARWESGRIPHACDVREPQEVPRRIKCGALLSRLRANDKLHVAAEDLQARDELIDRLLLVRLIQEAIVQYQELSSGIRPGLLRRFPYAVYFSVEGDVVVILAVLHASRDPAEWQRRRG
jgi:plasmid stabilization system protein ParE